jgi:hypothetical protein
VRLAGREPDDSERSVLLSLYADERTHYGDNVEAAKKLVAIGEHTANANLNPVELAAMTTVCQAIMNLDATIWRR